MTVIQCSSHQSFWNLLQTLQNFLFKDMETFQILLSSKEAKRSTGIQFGCRILRMVGPKKQEFRPKISIFKGNHYILRIRGAPVCQKLGMILENKAVQKLELEKNGFQKMVS